MILLRSVNPRTLLASRSIIMSSPSSSTLRQRSTPSSSSSSSTSPSASSAPHTHSHGLSHSHSHGSHTEETAVLSSAFSSLRSPSSLDPGSRITLIGLFSNVGLTALKGVAGYLLASSALLADAAHSGSDLIADVVTLASYRVGRWKPTEKYPYGYGKFESLGSLVVSFLLFATAAGIGLHSYHHLLLSLSTLPQMPADLLASLDFLPHGHSHGPEIDPETVSAAVVDARAMWFAAGSIAVKEWLYRATLKVAKQTHSNVLLANAYHHRSDSLGSLVALLAIGAARIGFPMLDPIGGLVVGGMIAKQGWDVGKEAIGELVDKLNDPSLPPKIYETVASLRDPSLPPLPPFSLVPSESSSSSHSHSHSHPAGSSPAVDPVSPSQTFPILSIPSIRLFASGPTLLVDIWINLPADLTMRETEKVIRGVSERVKEVVGDRCREVVVRVGNGGEVEKRGD
ncbi:cation diffusion facilitator family transporter [Sporobolomyces salmoneus]|uniref:cation diffusion facilitator family transporter n=1 Tax=Sporobolomyces salmoneus TaxID=183962 RepID=UPI0031793EF3